MSKNSVIVKQLRTNVLELLDNLLPIARDAANKDFAGELENFRILASTVPDFVLLSGLRGVVLPHEALISGRDVAFFNPETGLLKSAFNPKNGKIYENFILHDLDEENREVVFTYFDQFLFLIKATF